MGAGRGLPVVYANDNGGIWDGDAPELVRIAVEEGLAGPLVAAVAPTHGDRFVIKPRYSAFRLTPLTLIAREHGYKVSVVAEACSTVDEQDEELALRYLERVAGVRLATVAELARGAG